MMSRLKTYFWIALAIAAFYFLLSHHFIFNSLKDIDLLKKQELTLKYTFYWIRNHSAYDTLRIKELRDAGIEDILVDKGLVTDQELVRIHNRIDTAE